MQNFCVMPSGPCVPCGTSATPIYETKLLKALMVILATSPLVLFINITTTAFLNSSSKIITILIVLVTASPKCHQLDTNNFPSMPINTMYKWLKLYNCNINLHLLIFAYARKFKIALDTDRAILCLFGFHHNSVSLSLLAYSDNEVLK